MTPQTAWAHAAAAATLVAGYVVAFVPNFSQYESTLIAIGTSVFAAVILLAHAVRNRPAGQSILTATEDEVQQLLKTVDFGPVVQNELAKLVTANAAKGQTAVPVAGVTTTP